MFAEALQFLCAKPLSPKRLGSVILKKGGQLCWAEYGEVEKGKVKHTIFYFHGAPGCRFEPMMHSNLCQDKREIQENKSGRSNDQLGGVLSGLTSKCSNIIRNDVNGTICDNYGIDRKTTIGAKKEEIKENCSVIDLDSTLDIYSRRGIRLICVERPGFGESTYQESRTVADFIDDVIELTSSKEMNLFSDYSFDNGCDKYNNGSSEYHNVNTSSDSNSDCTLTVASTLSGLQNEKSNSSNGSSRDSNEKNNIQKNDDEVAKLYVIGYSAGAPYAIAMRYLFEKYQKKYQDKSNNDDKNHRISNHSNLRQPIKLVAVCAVAGSVSAADNLLYQKSLEGKILNLFFTLPLKVQSIFYSSGTYSVIIGLQIVIKCLSLANSVMNMYQSGLRPFNQKNGHNKEIEVFDVNDKVIENKISQEDYYIENNEKCQNSKIEYQIKAKITQDINLSIVSMKLSAIEKSLSKSLLMNGGKAMVMDTLATQWIGRPWGFDYNSSSNANITSSSTSTKHENSNLECTKVRGIDDDSGSNSSSRHGNHVFDDSDIVLRTAGQSEMKNISTAHSTKISETPHKNTEFPNETNELPPLLLYYSKEDSTVPSEMGIWLSEKTCGVGTEPVWLSGGHSCFILHLDRILDDLIKIK